MKIQAAIVLLLLSLAQCSIYDQYYAEAKLIAESMNIEQKIGQTIQANIEGVTEKEVTDPYEAVKLFLGSLLISGNAAPTTDGNLAKIPPLIE